MKKILNFVDEDIVSEKLGFLSLFAEWSNET